MTSQPHRDLTGGDTGGETCMVTTRTARKRRPCATCGADIQPGQRIKRVSFPPAAGEHGWASYDCHAEPCSSGRDI